MIGNSIGIFFIAFFLGHSAEFAFYKFKRNRCNFFLTGVDNFDKSLWTSTCVKPTSCSTFVVQLLLFEKKKKKKKGYPVGKPVKRFDQHQPSENTLNDHLRFTNARLALDVSDLNWLNRMMERLTREADCAVFKRNDRGTNVITPLEITAFFVTTKMT